MLPLIFYYSRMNRYSFNALAGAMDADPELRDLPVALARTHRELLDAVGAALSRSNTAVVGFSAFSNQAQEIRNLIAALRSMHGPRVVAIAGGPDVTADPKGMLESGVDVVLRGESEGTFPAVLKRLAEGRDLDDLPGVGVRKGGDISAGTRAAPVDINAYASFSPKRGMFGPIEITRGCPFACSFCQTSHIFGARPRHRSIDSIVRQALTLGPTKTRVVRLLSPNAFSYGSPDGHELNLAAIGSLLSELRQAISPGDRIVFGYFPSEVRPEHVAPEVLELVRRFADNDEIVLGAQSGSERILQLCHRSHTVQHVLQAVSNARKFGFKVIVDFIFGLPGETEDDTRDTMAVMEALSRMGARIHPHAFSPLPQTAFAKEPPSRIPHEMAQAIAALRRKRVLYENEPRVAPNG